MIKKKIPISINRIRYFKHRKVLVAFSGGKDSVVLYDLVKRSGIKAVFKYQNTTIDPPGTLSYIKQNFPDVEIANPELSFFKLIEKKGLPNRFQRWCCQYLKESNNKGFDVIMLGVRRQESAKRGNRKMAEKLNNELHVNPIIDWTEKDVWDYINANNLPVIKYYKEPYNFKRHGCVMCPLASSKQQIREAILFPKYAKGIMKSIKKFRETHQHLAFVKDYNDEYEMFYLWLKQELNHAGREKMNNNLFGNQAKEIINNVIFSECKPKK